MNLHIQETQWTQGEFHTETHYNQIIKRQRRKGNLDSSKKSHLKYTVHFSSVTQSSLTFCDPMDCRHQFSLSITNSQSLLQLMSTELVMPSNHLTLCGPLLFPPSIFPSIRIFFSRQFNKIYHIIIWHD